MKSDFRFAGLGMVGLAALSACASIPAEVTVAGCSVAPALVPEHAATIHAACAVQAATVEVVK